MTEEQKSFTVRYMPVKSILSYKILDTMTELGRVVCETYNPDDTYRIAKLLNESEGYVYEP